MRLKKEIFKKPITLAIIGFVFVLQACNNKSQKNVESKIHTKDTISKVDTALSSKNNKELSNHLNDKNELLFDIVGHYTVKDAVADCKMNLDLFYLKGQLKYKLQTSIRQISDDALIQLNEKKDGYYITFKNIEWSEYLGEVDAEGGTSEEDLPLPQEVQGVLYKDEISIQNTGNAMNYYVKIGECDMKYIHLIRSN